MWQLQTRNNKETLKKQVVKWNPCTTNLELNEWKKTDSNNITWAWKWKKRLSWARTLLPQRKMGTIPNTKKIVQTNHQIVNSACLIKSINMWTVQLYSNRHLYQYLILEWHVTTTTRQPSQVSRVSSFTSTKHTWKVSVFFWRTHIWSWSGWWVLALSKNECSVDFSRPCSRACCWSIHSSPSRTITSTEQRRQGRQLGSSIHVYWSHY